MSFSDELKKVMQQEIPKEIKESSYQIFIQIYKSQQKISKKCN